MNKRAKHDIRPPKLADRFLSWFCKDELLEEVKGDLYEFYRVESEDGSKAKANLKYWFHVLNFLRPFAFNRKRQNTNSIIMYRSYIKTGLRNLKKQKLASGINVFGLAVTIAISLVVYALVEKQFTLDNFHKDADRIFAVQSQIDWNGTEEIWGKSPMLIGPALLSEVPQVEQSTRVFVSQATVRFEDKVFNESITFADPSYLEIFSFPLIQGNSNALEVKTNVVLSSEAALKYYNDLNVIGKELKMVVDGKPQLFIVAGIAQQFPDNASFKFDFLVALQNVETAYGISLNDWDNIRNESVFTFVKLDDSQNAEALSSTFEKYLTVVNEINKDWQIKEFKTHELLSMARNGQFVKEPYASGSTPQILVMFGIISLLLLVSACFNYVNIAVSMAQKRLSEIAIRKVVGGQRKQLIGQFLTENFIVCFLATVLGAFIAVYFFLPGINVIFSGSNYYISLTEDPFVSLFLFGIFLVLGLSSGAYPALYISKFRPVEILKGKLHKAKRNGLGKFFLTAQFFLTFIAIVSGLLFTSINEFQKDQDWGYNPKNTIVLPVSGVEQFTAMREFAVQTPRVKAWAGMGNSIGRSRSQQPIQILEERHTVRTFRVGPGYLENLETPFISGRGFDEQLFTDQKSIIVNEEFMRKLKPTDMSEAEFTVKIGTEDFNIIGVVADFHFDNFFSPIVPVIFQLEKEDYNYIMLKTVGQNLTATEEVIKTEWARRFPDTPYAGFFQEEVFDQFFRETKSLKDVMSFVAYIAILLSSTGLFGLASLMIFRKIKEYSVRKVLGAKSKNIVALVSKEFFVLLGIALLLGLPVSYFSFDMMFEQIFPGSMDGLSAVPFITAIFILMGVILITISTHIIQLLRTNPVKNLRLE